MLMWYTICVVNAKIELRILKAIALRKIDFDMI
jgi:hypothetical protein